PYLEQKLAEINAWNETNAVSDEPSPNARRLTNVGCFRAYVESYLREHPKIHKDLTFLVRQLAPTTHGMPLEIYVFTTDTAWAVYEGIQSDIFDHLLTVLSKFQLEVFQSPSGRDMRLLPEALLTLPSRAASN